MFSITIIFCLLKPETRTAFLSSSTRLSNVSLCICKKLVTPGSFFFCCSFCPEQTWKSNWMWYLWMINTVGPSLLFQIISAFNCYEISNTYSALLPRCPYYYYCTASNSATVSEEISPKTKAAKNSYWNFGLLNIRSLSTKAIPL